MLFQYSGILVAAVCAASAEAQLIVRVIDDGSGQPIANAEVLDRATQVRWRSDERGEVRIAGNASKSLALRVRQIGFQPTDQTLADAPAHDTVVVQLRRMAYSLPAVLATARSACDDAANPAAARLSAMLLHQLRLTAEQYESFRRDYPFTVEIGRRTARMRGDSLPTGVTEAIGSVHSDDWREPYRPGRVLIRGGMGFSVPILFLSTLADSAFWAAHCFAFAGVDARGEERWLRLEFSPSRDIASPDWAGTAFIDSATSALRRLEFQLINLRGTSVPRRLEGFTTFRSPSPYMVVPDTTVAVWWRRQRVREEWGDPDVGQMLYIRRLTWSGQRPTDQR